MLEHLTSQAAPHLVRFAKIKAGQRVLDVGCGTGVVSLGAAREGAQVTGIDLTPELIVTAKEHATLARLNIDYLEGDAEKLSFPDESFDVVVSQFGHIFAPRPEVATKEMLRVLKEGGTIAFSTWPRGLFTADMFSLMAKYGPPPMPGVSSPVAWGDQEFVKTQLGDAVTHLAFSRDLLRVPALSVPHNIQFMLTHLGPAKRVAESLSPERLAVLKEELEALGLIYFRDNAIDQHFNMSRAIKK